jgi:hypothetical protein
MDDDAIPDSLGPAMEALPKPQWRVWVMNFVVTGNAAEASRRSGFGTESTSDKDFARIGYRLLRRDDVRMAIMEETRNHYHTAAAAAVREVRRILDDPKAKDADKLRAADGILARFDPIITGQVVRVEHEHHHRVDHATATLEALRFLKSLDVPRDKLVEHFGYSGLARYEAQLIAADAKAGKLIEGRAEAAT